MALVLADRVRETTSTTGTGTLTLTGPFSGFRAFSAIGDGNTTYYAIADANTGEWEVGVGTYSTSGNTLSRDTVLDSSNTGSLVVFATGAKDVICTQPAERAVYLEAAGTSTIVPGITISGLTASTALALDASKDIVSVANTGTGSNVLNTSPTLVTPALGTPSSGVVTNLTGTASININGTVGASTPSTGAFTTLSASGTSTLAAVNSGALAVTGAISSTTDATLSGVRVGKGAGAIASNTALGSGALNANTTGSNNTANGLNALYSNTTGSNNTASGVNALNANTTGNWNTASGRAALYYNTTGSSNTASGQGALYSNTTGSSNTASGINALYSNTTGIYNTASGFQALYSNTTGSYNTASGRAALYYNTTGSGNTALNPLSSGGYAPVFNPTTENNRFCMGSTAVTNAYIQVAWTVVSDARDKINFAPVPHGLEFVKALQPTAYQFRIARDSEETNGGVRYGFKAQDVLELEGTNPVIVDNEDADKLRMVDTALIPVIVKAIQEQQALIESLTTRLTALESNP